MDKNRIGGIRCQMSGQMPKGRQAHLTQSLARLSPIERPSSGQPENPQFYRWMVSVLVSIAERTTFSAFVPALKPKHFSSPPRQA